MGDSTVLNARGVLDDSTYLALRDQVIGAALEEPDSVIVDVTELDVPSESAWLALTSASRQCRPMAGGAHLAGVPTRRGPQRHRSQRRRPLPPGAFDDS